MHRTANMSSSEPGQGRSKSIAHERMSDYDGMQSLEQRALVAVHPHFSQPGTPSTVTSRGREQNDSATANMATIPCFQGMLTPEQKKERDLKDAWLKERYPLGQQLQLQI